MKNILSSILGAGIMIIVAVVLMTAYTIHKVSTWVDTGVTKTKELIGG